MTFSDIRLVEMLRVGCCFLHMIVNAIFIDSASDFKWICGIMCHDKVQALALNRLSQNTEVSCKDFHEFLIVFKAEELWFFPV